MFRQTIRRPTRSQTDVRVKSERHSSRVPMLNFVPSSARGRVTVSTRHNHTTTVLNSEIPVFGRFFSSPQNNASRPTNVPAVYSPPRVVPRKKKLGPKLTVLDEIVKTFAGDERFDFSNVVFVCGQHLLRTTTSLFESLIELNADPENIFVAGKNYSSNPHVVSALQSMGVHVQTDPEQLILGGFDDTYDSNISDMWKKCFKHIKNLKERNKPITGLIILDDGGHVASKIPAEVYQITTGNNMFGDTIDIVSIEQTSSGLPSNNRLPFRTIEAATTALKRWIEPPLVARKSVDEIEKSISRVQERYRDVTFPEKPLFGIVGLGKIGKSIVERMIANGHENFLICDRNEEIAKNIKKQVQRKHKSVSIECVNTQTVVFLNSDIIVGCTGTNLITESGLDAFKSIREPKLLISVSSKDLEFKMVLDHIQERNRKTSSRQPCRPLDDIYYKNGFKAPIILARGGTPIGFTNEEDSVSPRGIEPIRGLLLAACVQARHMFYSADKTPESYMVDPELQSLIMQSWLASKPNVEYSADLVQNAVDIGAILGDSGGVPYSIGIERKYGMKIG